MFRDITMIWTAEAIRGLRKEFNLTQLELSEKLGCRQQTVSEWEVGAYSPKNAYQKLLSCLHEELHRGKNAVPSANP